MVDLSTSTLDELASYIKGEHSAAEDAVQQAADAALEALQHVCNVGEALLAARELVEPGEWQAWMENNLEFDSTTARSYQRVTLYRSVLQPWAEAGGSGHLRDAMRVLRGLPSLVPAHRTRPGKVTREERTEVKRLVASGMNYAEVARAVGLSAPTVHACVDRDWDRARAQRRKEKEARERAAERARQREERAKEAKRVGGAVGAAYGHLRQALMAMDAALSASTNSDEREMLKEASSLTYKAEDAIGAALKIARRLVA